MEITPKDAFKLGFLTRCAEEKLTGDALDERLTKVALVSMSPLNLDVGKMLGYGTEAYSSLLAAPIAASILGGGALGMGAAKLVEPRIDDEEMKAQELATTYRLYAEKAKNRKKLRQYRTGQDNA
jgi:hypothetical protein